MMVQNFQHNTMKNNPSMKAFFKMSPAYCYALEERIICYKEQN